MKSLAELLENQEFLNEKTTTLIDYGIIAYRVSVNQRESKYVYLKLNESREYPIADMKYENVVIRKDSN